MHKYLYDMAESEAMIANRAFDRLRSEITHGVVNNDKKVLALLRSSLENFPELHHAGIEFGWQYAQLTRAQLVAICGDTSTSVRLFLATTHGLLVDTVFSEEQMRDILNRPRNLFANEGTEAALSGLLRTVLMDLLSMRDIMELDDACHAFRARPRLESLLPRWNAQDLGLPPDVLRRAEASIVQLGLWAPLVWTQEERQHRIAVGHDEETNDAALAARILAENVALEEKP